MEARKSGALDAFTAEIQTRLGPLITRVYDSAEMVNSDIEGDYRLLTEVAEELLPCVQPKRRSRFRDNVLSRLCAQSRAARAAWRDAGSPPDGPLFEEKNRMRRAVRKRARWCAARTERSRVQRRDRLFATGDNHRFKTPQRKKSRCSRLVVEDVTVQDPEVLLKVWAEHFQKLGESKLGATTDACQWKRKVESLESQSHSNEEFLLDVPFTAEEVSGAVTRLKGKKAPRVT